MIIAWIRVSRDKQDYDRQEHTILKYANERHWRIDRTFEYTMSTGKRTLRQRVQKLLDSLQPNDMLLVDEVWLGRDLRDILNLIHDIRERQLFLVCIKERIEITDDELDLTTEATIGAFGLCYMIERKLTQQRTKEMMAALKAKGVKVGRPKGRLGTSKLDGKVAEIQHLMHKGVTKANIAKILDVSRSTLVHYIQTRNLS